MNNIEEMETIENDKQNKEVNSSTDIIIEVSK